MLLHSDTRVVRFGFWGGQKGQGRAKSRDFMSSTNQFAADSLSLEFRIDGEIGKIGAIMPIGYGSRNPNQLGGFAPGREDEIRMPKHAVDLRGIRDGPAFCEPRSIQNIDEFG